MGYLHCFLEIEGQFNDIKILEVILINQNNLQNILGIILINTIKKRIAKSQLCYDKIIVHNLLFKGLSVFLEATQ